MKSLDIFGVGIGFNIAGKHKSYSYLGALLTIYVFMITGLYAFKRYTIMVNLNDTTYNIIPEDSHYSADEPLR